MATNVVDIDQIPPDVDDLAVGKVKNPLKEDFIHPYASKPQVIPASGEKEFPLHVAVHLAKHLAEKIVRAEFRARIARIKDVKEKEIESAKPIPDYKGKIWEKMKELVETDSNFFDDNKDGSNSENKEKFLK